MGVGDAKIGLEKVGYRVCVGYGAFKGLEVRVIVDPDHEGVEIRGCLAISRVLAARV